MDRAEMIKDIKSQFDKIVSSDINSLSRRDTFGIKNFDEMIPSMTEVYDILAYMIVNIELNRTVPIAVIPQLKQHFLTFMSYVERIKKCDFQSDSAQNFNERNRIIQEWNNYYRSIYEGRISDNQYNNLLTLYNAARATHSESLSQLSDEISALKSTVQNKISELKSLEDALREKAASETITDYGNIFRNQAKIHSQLDKPNFKKLFIGAAEIWLSFGIFLLGIGLYWFTKHPNYFYNPSIKGLENIIPFAISKLVIISMWLFSIKFTLRQYAINKHLGTINKHRENVLKSFKLFIQTIDPNDTSTRNVIMLEVAKAIYEAGKTGYLSDKGHDATSPSIIELNRFIPEIRK
jgi:hypothetical protein